MQISKIHSMSWANAQHTSVVLIADSNTGQYEQICTPYSFESIIWDAVQTFPKDQIAEYVAPVDTITDVEVK